MLPSGARRGIHPVGVTTLVVGDAGRVGRSLSVEVWYPATPCFAGHDLDPGRQDRFELVPGLARLPQEAVRDALPSAEPGRPVVLFSHGHGGHRRQSTFLCTHLASHGYVVAAPDHPGNTMRDVMRAALAERSGKKSRDPASTIPALVESRPADLAAVLAALVEDSPQESPETVVASPAVHSLWGVLDPRWVAVCGHSFGGWTALVTAEREPRVKAVVALAPAGGATELDPGDLQRALCFTRRPAPATLVIAADRDSLLPLAGIEAMVGKMHDPRRLVVLERADHMHFCDRAAQVHEMFRAMPPPGGFRAVAARTPPFEELCSAEEVVDAVRRLTLEHLTAHAT